MEHRRRGDDLRRVLEDKLLSEGLDLLPSVDVSPL